MLRAICNYDESVAEFAVGVRSGRRVKATRYTAEISTPSWRSFGTLHIVHEALVEKTTKPLGWYYSNSMACYGENLIPPWFGVELFRVCDIVCIKYVSRMIFFKYYHELPS